MKERLRLLKKIFKEVGINDKVIEKIENKCISMCNLGFPEIDIFSRMNEEVKEYLDNNERDRFKFVNIADKYDLDLSFLG